MGDSVDADEPPELETRTGRAIAYLRHNRDQILVDVVLLTAWTVAAAGLFRWLGLPRWLLYLVVFVGVAMYSRLTASWERPYESPD